MGGVQEEWNVDTGEMECEHGRMERYLPVQKSTGIMDRSGAQQLFNKKMTVCRKWAAGSDRGWIDGKIILLLWCKGSSKTANALMTHFNYEEVGQKALLCKPAIDARDGRADGIFKDRAST